MRARPEQLPEAESAIGVVCHVVPDERVVELVDDIEECLAVRARDEGCVSGPAAGGGGERSYCTVG